MKLFQIEEPDGSPADPDAPGAAVGIDLSGALAEIAVAVGGNAVALTDRDGFTLDLTVSSPSVRVPDWQMLLERARLRAERALARPVTHAVIVANAFADADIRNAAAAVGLVVLCVMTPDQLAAGERRALAAAILAEDLAPRIAAPE